MAMEPGIYKGLSDSDYRAGGGLTSTLLRKFMKAPRVARAVLEGEFGDEPEPSEVLKTGLLCHAMVLEPETVNGRFAVMPEGLKRTTKEGKATYQALCDEVGDTGVVVKNDQWVTACGVRDSVLAHPLASRYLACGDPELSVFVRDPETGLLLCCRCDWLCPYPCVVVDLKSCMTADLYGFSRDAIKHGYHVQAAHYIEVCRLAGIKAKDFLFIAAEKEVPYLCRLFRLSPVLLDYSRQLWRDAVNNYSESQQTGVWPGYDTGISDIALPRYLELL